MFGICILSIVPVRKNRDDKSEMISQLLYGDLYEVIEKKDKWLLIKTVFDNYKGWIDNKQFLEIKSEDLFNQLIKTFYFFFIFHHKIMIFNNQNTMFKINKIFFIK